MAVAGLAGRDWVEKTKQAALLLSEGEDQEDESFGVQLLSDIRDYFEQEDGERVSSETLSQYLVALEDRPWPEYRHGKPITSTGISRILKRFGIKSRQMKISGKNQKGYLFEDFKDVFSRYLPNPAYRKSTESTKLKNNDLGENQKSTLGKEVDFGNKNNANKFNTVDPVDFQTHGIEEKEENVETDVSESLFGKTLWEARI